MTGENAPLFLGRDINVKVPDSDARALSFTSLAIGQPRQCGAARRGRHPDRALLPQTSESRLSHGVKSEIRILCVAGTEGEGPEKPRNTSKCH